MQLTGRIPLPGLIELCRTLHHSLAAGLTLRKVFQMQARKGSGPVRLVAERISQRLERGDSLEAALKEEQKVFPPLFLSLAAVGESTGNLAEIFGELEKYYRLQQTFWRQFWSQAILPILQLVAAIFIIAGLIFVLGIIGTPGTTDPLGVGLSGTMGAIKFLFICFGSIGALILGYVLLSRSLQHKAVVDGILLRLWAVGPFLEALTLGRFALALHLTLETGMPITRALGLSLRGTGNAAFAIRAKVVQETLRAGDSLTVALTRAGVFPHDFLTIVAMAEEGGRVPEVMRQQAPQYFELAEVKLRILSRVAGFAIWFFVALIIVILIFRLYSRIYLPYINQAVGQ
jgi:type II secretory pathway component PulF